MKNHNKNHRSNNKEKGVKKEKEDEPESQQIHQRTVHTKQPKKIPLNKLASNQKKVNRQVQKDTENVTPNYRLLVNNTKDRIPVNRKSKRKKSTTWLDKMEKNSRKVASLVKNLLIIFVLVVLLAYTGYLIFCKKEFPAFLALIEPFVKKWID